MKTKTSLAPLALVLFASVLPLAAESARPQTSIQIGAGYDFAYTNQLSGESHAWDSSATYQYHLGEDYLLGIVLGKFILLPSAAEDAFFYNYGFTFTHFIPKTWLDLGAFKPGFTYGILLSQTWKEDTAGRDIAHNTLIGLGGEFTLADKHRLGLNLNWTSAHFPTLGVDDSQSISSLGVGLSYRYIF